MPDVVLVVLGAAGALQRMAVVFSPHAVVCDARGGVSGWVFASLLLLPSFRFCLFCEHALCAADSAFVLQCL